LKSIFAGTIVSKPFNMKIATLQFFPRLGEVAANFSRAESLLMRQETGGELEGIDLLVLPELAFSGESQAPKFR
jgi:predicted amidohydrolase